MSIMQKIGIQLNLNPLVGENSKERNSFYKRLTRLQVVQVEKVNEIIKKL